MRAKRHLHPVFISFGFVRWIRYFLFYHNSQLELIKLLLLILAILLSRPFRLFSADRVLKHFNISFIILNDLEEG